MPEKLYFAFREASRLIRIYLRVSMELFFSSLFNLILINQAFIIFINLNYFMEVFTTGSLSKLVFLYLFLTIFAFLLIYYNRLYLGKFLVFYRREIELVIRFKCDLKLVFLPPVLVVFWVNLLAMTANMVLTVKSYTFFSVFISRNYLNFSLLPLQSFDSTLFFFLLLLTAGGTIITGWYFYRQQEKTLE
jgi:hypothetical protein